jgi:hypothetical protein
MKTLGRILIILAVTALVTAALYLIVNASGTGTSADFQPRGEQFQPVGTRLDFEAGRPERDGMGGGLSFEWIKNVAVIGLIVAIMVLPKSLSKKKRLATVEAASRDLN